MSAVGVDHSWRQLREQLLRAAPQANGEDVVQTVLKCLIMKRFAPDQRDTLCLGLFMVKCTSIDMRRRERQSGLRYGWEERAYPGESTAPDPAQGGGRLLEMLSTDLRQRLGARAVELLSHIASGCRSTESLGRRMGVHVRSIGRRRARIQGILGKFCAELHANGQG